MPRGVLTDDLYTIGSDNTNFTDHCAIIEAADIRRFNKDVFMQYGGYSNQKGFNWLNRSGRQLKTAYVKYYFKHTDAGRSSGSLNISVISQPKWLKFCLQAHFFEMFGQTKFQLSILSFNNYETFIENCERRR